MLEIGYLNRSIIGIETYFRWGGGGASDIINSGLTIFYWQANARLEVPQV